MKFTIAIIALLGNVSAINLRDSADVTDLFNDDSQEAETLKSIADAEKAHGRSIPASIANENVKEILVQRSNVEFKDDEFVKLNKGQTADKTLLQLDVEEFEYPEARPIGEMLA